MNSRSTWPVIAGTYQVGDPQGSVAICTLTSESLIEPLAYLPGVAITGKVFTANLGITRIVANILANPAIRFLLICGRDSPLFHPGQSLAALAEYGMDAECQIIGAIGYDPVLRTLTPEHIEQFRHQVEVIDWTGEEDVDTLRRRISELAARNPGRVAVSDDMARMSPPEDQFSVIRPGGVREPLQYDPKGYFVITLDREEEQIVLRHYLPGHTPAHEMRGHAATSMLLGLLREDLVTQLSHAGYLGEELAKAESALRLGLRYDQDRPLRPQKPPSEAEIREAARSEESATLGDTSVPVTRPPIPQPQPPMTLEQWAATTSGMEVNVVLSVTDLTANNLLGGVFLEADEAEPFSAFRLTSGRILIRWASTTKIVMGGPPDLETGALVRVRGKLSDDHLVDAEGIVILTHVARIIEP